MISKEIYDKIEKTSVEESRLLMQEVISWDLCDHLCKNLILKQKGYEELIYQWADSENTYEKRAAFTLIASAAVHKKNISDEELKGYLQVISENSGDEREHVKKAVSWALREIGKKDFNFNKKAVLMAHEIA